jgi:mono/diheme cytochrome c family protein
VRDATADSAALAEGEIADVAALGPGAWLEAWERAGADVFERVPTQIDLALDVLRDRAEAEAAGLRVDEDGLVQGALEVETETGWVVALSCAACHSAERDGVLVRGVPNERFDLGAILGAGWPRGTVDVTGDGIDNPVRPSDLRPIALQARLHHAGDLANGRVARMVRIETLLITQRGERARPDRRMVAALSLYLESLERTLPELDRASEGGQLFEATCAGCHAGEALGGEPVPVEIVGTDPRATSEAAERSTLGYRAPSLRGVGDRRAVLHDGTAADLDAMLGLVPSSHVGHPFGRHLPEEERRAIARFLRAESE